MNGRDALSIAVLLPDVLGTYSDAGNAVVLAQRARWRGLDADIVPVLADDTPPAGCDIYLLGGGEDTAQVFAVDWLAGHRDVLGAMSGSAVTFAVCAGLQILGTTLIDGSGYSRDGLGLLDLSTAPARARAVGELVSECDVPGVGLLTGFENHRGTTTLGPDARPLGKVCSGIGNGAPHPGGAVDGAVQGDIVATYMHGPALARNPALADHLLWRATGAPFDDADMPDVPDLPALRRTYLAATGRIRATPRAARPGRR
ncbi:MULTISPECIES: glutamine amidotransferase [unclassified Pseudonocardia]|uniref:type 1 glutamine amidotransferase n=1 Tax=unclassified Pseudonocardia TaxID=2619320 RepID=UPI000A692373|nr:MULTISPECIES: glutamine amidotransferase [unclassified Pseudonocardia]MBN9098094.1 glutamine amidotransferase [Pseudonocardia sp.]